MGIYLYELRRAFCSRRFFLAVAVALVPSLLQLITGPLAYGFGEIWARWRSGLYGVTPPSLYGTWMGGTLGSVFSELFYVLAPLFCCLPYAWSLGSDLHGGFAGVLVQRCDARSYLCAKSAACFLAAAAVVVVPQAVNFWLSALCVPTLSPDPAAGMYAVFARSAFSELFYAWPILYVGLYLLISAVTMGLFSVLAMLLAMPLRNTGLVAALPLIADELLYFALFCLGLGGYAPSRVIMPNQPVLGIEPVWVLVEICFLAVASAVLLYRRIEEFEVI